MVGGRARGKNVRMHRRTFETNFIRSTLLKVFEAHDLCMRRWQHQCSCAFISHTNVICEHSSLWAVKSTYLDNSVSTDSDQKFASLVKIHCNNLVTYVINWRQRLLPYSHHNTTSIHSLSLTVHNQSSSSFLWQLLKRPKLQPYGMTECTQRIMHYYAAYCYRCRTWRGLCAGHMDVLCKNGWTDPVAIWGLTRVGPTNHI